MEQESEQKIKESADQARRILYAMGLYSMSSGVESDKSERAYFKREIKRVLDDLSPGDLAAVWCIAMRLSGWKSGKRK